MNPRSLRFRMTAWYAGLLAATLLIVGVSVYLGMRRYLDWTLEKTLAAECRTIGTELLWQLPTHAPAWLSVELNEDYAPDINGKFLRITQQGVGVIYLSGVPKNGTFDPQSIPQPLENDKDGLVASLNASFEFCSNSLAKVDDSKLGDTIQAYGGREVPRAWALIALTNDWADHYSAAATYLRLNGLLPPTAQKK